MMDYYLCHDNIAGVYNIFVVQEEVYIIVGVYIPPKISKIIGNIVLWTKTKKFACGGLDLISIYTFQNIFNIYFESII